ncbi:protein-disulfide reductase DsbD [Glaesserella parasuis]|nr:protein-disulfide reductase DsbD [Glaesserella parasuis]MCT8587439.1 protein-disulfide reductase DsbD [Glaesserella parasuis]MCT8595331.1 protein-disulfide reductase DsbD [Glaesserella parasuis]MCT8600305.1 protein-disulfide reductase DsbD [Glaesserella parasuis]MCT8601321.1 protein-disulfide reductase DsbD [Glaesserella parasuis]
MSTFYLPATASLFSSQPKFLPGDQAFAFSSQQQADQLQLAWQIADGYYLYKKEIAISSNNAKLGEPQFPTAERYQDEFFGEVEIYRNQLTIPVALEANATGQVLVRYQGCTKGFCYPPEEVTLDLQAATSADNVAKNTADVTAISVAQPKAEQNQLAETLAENRLAIFWFFVLGLGLAFTSCVLPMLPLLSAIVIGSKQRPNSLRAFLLSLSYVQGMAVTYTLLGLLVAAIGLPFQVALQSPPVLIGLSLLFILLAMSIFGLFTLQLPHRWQQKLNQLSQQQQGGSFFSVFVMGMIAGLVASPCTSAPLSGALLYVAQSGDLLTGGLALYLLALGMGIPLMLVTLFGNRILPKSGDWLLKVKTLFGFVMLALPVFLLSRVLPTFIEPLLWSALAIAFLLWLNEQCNSLNGWKKVLRLLVLATLVVASKPWLDLAWQPTLANQTQSNHFKRIHSLAELEQQLAANKGKKVMLDLYADWCVACKEFEKYTFVDPKVQAKLAEMAVLQIDMTKNSRENDELMKHFQVLGLPTILFFDEQGRELSQSRVTGFMQAGDFVQWLNGLTQ